MCFETGKTPFQFGMTHGEDMNIVKHPAQPGGYLKVG